jgi:integrase
MGLLYHGSCALASHSVVWLLERPGEAVVRSGARFPHRGDVTGCFEHWDEARRIIYNRHGTYLLPEVVSNQFHALLARAGLPEMCFHDLRHTMATLLLGSDVHPKKVQERLGHSTIAITMDTYSHVLPSMHQDVARKLDDLFKE